MRRVVLPFMLALAALSGAAPAGAASIHCPSTRGTLAGGDPGRVWQHGGSLYGCTTNNGERLSIHRMGPWTAGSKVAFDGIDVVWTVRRGGADRAYAGEVDDGSRWLTGTNLIPGAPGAPFQPARAVKVFSSGAAAGWVTTAGQVVMALVTPGAAPAAIGTLPDPLRTSKQLTLIGTFRSEGATTLASGVRIRERTTSLEVSDDCAGYEMTFPAHSSGPRIGIHWANFFSQGGGNGITGCDQ